MVFRVTSLSKGRVMNNVYVYVMVVVVVMMMSPQTEGYSYAKVL